MFSKFFFNEAVSQRFRSTQFGVKLRTKISRILLFVGLRVFCFPILRRSAILASSISLVFPNISNTTDLSLEMPIHFSLSIDDETLFD